KSAPNSNQTSADGWIIRIRPVPASMAAARATSLTASTHHSNGPAVFRSLVSRFGGRFRRLLVVRLGELRWPELERQPVDFARELERNVVTILYQHENMTSVVALGRAGSKENTTLPRPARRAPRRGAPAWSCSCSSSQTSRADDSRGPF